MYLPIPLPKQIGRQKLYEIAEYAVAALVLLYGIRHIREIIAIVLMELYKYLIQHNMLPAAIGA